MYLCLLSLWVLERIMGEPENFGVEGGVGVTFNSRAVATVTVVFPESAALPWCLHDDQSISFIIPGTLAGKARPRAGRAQWEPG